VITQELTQRRGDIERAFLRFHPVATTTNFEFSLGVALSQIPLAKSALLLLRWLDAALTEHDLDWLFSGGFAATAEESASLQACMRTLRRFDSQRPQWTLEAFLNQTPIFRELPSDWRQRMLEAQRTLKSGGPLLRPGEWCDRVPQLLDIIRWAGSVPSSSAEFQAQRRWQQALDVTGSLGFDGGRMTWNEFLRELTISADEVLFAPESIDAPIQIAGPAEAAGLTADAIWFLGADEESWPAVASMHPFLPVHVQRASGMPHASPLQDWEYSSAVTQRLLSSAPLVNFSYARQKQASETRPSRLVLNIVGTPELLPSEVAVVERSVPMVVTYSDSSTVPFKGNRLRGGAAALSSQSQCPFKAFATARLGAQSWDPAEIGLSPRQRGKLLHDILASIWSGRRPGIKTSDDLKAIKDLARFVRTHVTAVLATGLPPAIREQMPPVYLQLEETRLIRLITEWLEFEKTRVRFAVEQTEAQSTVSIAGMSMDIRLDRVDRLHDDSHLVVDYKTGNVDPKSWDLPRPDDVQLPLYKLFGLEPLQASLFDTFGGPASGGMVFARVRPGDVCFAGRVADAKATLNAELNGKSALVRRKLTAVDEAAWKDYIVRLAEDFIQGRAEVNPRDYPNTCDRCGLHSVCRIQEDENRARFEKGAEDDGRDGE
jgi:probable DNA repair protein